MLQDSYNLSRFIEAQDRIYPIALKELHQGRKRSHWMWYVFPQLKHLGHSFNSRFYGISGLEEAKAYLANPVLNQRLREAAMAILNLPADNAVEVFGGIDSQKLLSSMTLFDAASPGDVFARVLQKYFGSCRDRKTLELLNPDELTE